MNDSEIEIIVVERKQQLFQSRSHSFSAPGSHQLLFIAYYLANDFAHVFEYRFVYRCFSLIKRI